MTMTSTESAEPAEPGGDAENRPAKVRTRPSGSKSLFDPAIMKRATVDSFVKLDPRQMMRNPVMFIVEVGSVLTTILFFQKLPSAKSSDSVFTGLVSAWLWFTVLFANFAEAVAEGRGKAQADTLRKTRSETVARIRQADGTITEKSSNDLLVGDECVVVAGELIPGDGEIIEGIASVDESAITGESAPVIRESGGDRSAVTGGTRVLSDEIIVRITSKPGETFLDRMIALVEGASRQKTPNEIALNILLAGLTIIFLLAVVTLQPFAIYSKASQSLTVLVALLVCLIPTTIGALLSAIGIAGMDRLVQRNVLAMSGRAVEAAGDCSTLLLDKTGTITYGNRQAAQFLPVPGVDEHTLADAAMLSSLADETPEGRSIVTFAEEHYGLVPRELPNAELVAFTAQTRMSGVDFDGHSIRKGAADSVRRWVVEQGGHRARRARDDRRRHRDARRHAARGRERQERARRDLPQGRRQAGHARALRPDARDGHPHGDDHRRQPAHRGRDRGRGRRRRLPRRGHARRQDGADQARAARRLDGGDDGRRDQRRSRARRRRRRRRDEHGHAGRQRGRQHGRPRLESDEAHRDRRNRQAAADHPRVARRRSRSRTTSPSTSRSSRRCSRACSRSSTR